MGQTANCCRRQLPDGRVELVDDANHMVVVVVDQFEIVEKLLADFLR